MVEAAFNLIIFKLSLFVLQSMTWQYRNDYHRLGRRQKFISDVGGRGGGNGGGKTVPQWKRS